MFLFKLLMFVVVEIIFLLYEITNKEELGTKWIS